MLIYSNIASDCPNAPRINLPRVMTSAPTADPLALAKRASDAGQPLILDIEGAKFDLRRSPRATVTRAVADYIDLTHRIRAVDPSLPIGAYGLMPLSDWGAVTFHARSQRETAAWWVGNREKHAAAWRGWLDASVTPFMAMAQQVDFVCPSLYLHYGPANPQSWWPEADAEYATGMCRAARMFGKPVVPFVWGWYHNQSAPIPVEQWQPFVQAIRDHADGLIWWHPTFLPWTEVNQRQLEATIKLSV